MRLPSVVARTNLGPGNYQTRVQAAARAVLEDGASYVGRGNDLLWVELDWQPRDSPPTAK